MNELGLILEVYGTNSNNLISRILILVGKYMSNEFVNIVWEYYISTESLN